MRRGATPTHTITVTGIDLSQQHSIHITLTQNKKLVADFTEADECVTIEENEIRLFLGQQTSLGLSEGAKLEFQVNGLTADGKRWVSNIQAITVDRQTLGQIIE